MTALGVSVIIPTYNRAALLPRAIASVVAATDGRDEIIVADDGSTDDTERALAPYRSRIVYLRLPHAGAGAAVNAGVRAATRPLLGFLDSDDEWLPDKLALQRAFMERRPDVLYCFSDLIRRDAGGADVPHALREWHGDPRSWDEILGPGVLFSSVADLPRGRADFRVHVGNLYLRQLQASYLCIITVLVRRDGAADAMRFAEDLPPFENGECLGRLAGRGPGAYFDCDTAVCWDHDGPRLTDVDPGTAWIAQLTILDRVWGSDAAFLAQHGDDFRRIYRSRQREAAEWLLRRGATRAARAVLGRRIAGPLAYRALASLPGPFVRGLLRCRRVLRRRSAERE